MRHTPAGLPVVEFRLGHTSAQMEAGLLRQVECELAGIALGDTARLLAAASLGDGLMVSGFLAARSLKSRAPVLHVTEIEFKEGNENGIQTQDRHQA